MGEPAEMGDRDRAEVRSLARQIVEAVDADRDILSVVHDYRDDELGETRTGHEADEAHGIDRTKFGDVEASDDFEMALVEMSQEIAALERERDEWEKTARAASRMDANEMRAFRAWMYARRDRVVELALEIGRHWREQEGVNGGLLDQLAEVTGK